MALATLEKTIALDLGGTYRALSAEGTLQKVEPLLYQRFGISRVGNVTGLDNIGIPVYVAVRPASRFMVTAQGKGITHNLAKVSAIMESIEGWHAENMRAPDLFGSYDQLKDNYPLIELQEQLNYGAFIYQNITALPIPWARGIELNTRAPIYFPYTLINMVMDEQLPGYMYFLPSTNGLASGNTYEEAVCHGLFEVIEREMEADKHDVVDIDPKTIRNPHLLSLLDRIAAQPLELTIQEFRHPIGVPTYQALLADPASIRSVGTQKGSGTHFSSVVALSRAITEAVQARVVMIAGSREDFYPSVYRSEIKYISEPKTPIKREPFVEVSAPSLFNDMITQACQRLTAQGYDQVICYDHTRSDIGIPVVHVLVPGMRFDITEHTNG